MKEPFEIVVQKLQGVQQSLGELLVKIPGPHPQTLV